MGLPWLIKADLYPGIVDHTRTQYVSNNFRWAYRHRGATHPDFAGVGAGLQAYRTECE
jgi:amidase/formamidase